MKECSFCGKEFHSKTGLSDHVAMKHSVTSVSNKTLNLIKKYAEIGFEVAKSQAPRVDMRGDICRDQRKVEGTLAELSRQVKA